jgi:short-subunit dehydrogenase
VASSNGHLVAMSSAFGLIGVPRYSAYCASKFAIRGYTDALRLEMVTGGLPVTVSCVVSGGVRTQIVRSGSFATGEEQEAVAEGFERRIARTSPEQAAARILRDVQRGKPQIFVGTDARLVALLTRATGTGYQRLLPRLLGRGATARRRPPTRRYPWLTGGCSSKPSVATATRNHRS